VTAGLEHTANVTSNAKEFTNIKVNNKKSTKVHIHKSITQLIKIWREKN